MTIEIIGNVIKDRLYCAGSFSKLLTTFAVLSLLSETYQLSKILDDTAFFDSICTNKKSQEFLKIFQAHLGGKFSIHDICSFYAGLPYTFDISKEEIENVDAGNLFKHHSILDEKKFLEMCKNNITPVYRPQCKFHYSELSIIFLGYLIEQVYELKIEELYSKYIIQCYNLKNSYFSRKKLENVYIQDLSDSYDFASIAIQDHGFFCYSNGFYTTLNDTKILLEGLIENPIFQLMTNIKIARAASSRLMNGLTIEIRVKEDDVIFGYDGLSFSGCNLWAYSNKTKQGYLTFNDSGNLADKIIFEQFGYSSFDKVPEYTQEIYNEFIKNYPYLYKIENRDIPIEFQGDYQRVKINEKNLEKHYAVSKDFIEMRIPEDIEYKIIMVNNIYRILCKDHVHGGKVGLYQAESGNNYISFGGALLKKR